MAFAEQRAQAAKLAAATHASASALASVTVSIPGRGWRGQRSLHMGQLLFCWHAAPCRSGRLQASSGEKLNRPQTRPEQRDGEGGERRGDGGAARERRGAQRLRRRSVHLKSAQAADLAARLRVTSCAHAHALYM